MTYTADMYGSGAWIVLRWRCDRVGLGTQCGMAVVSIPFDPSRESLPETQIGESRRQAAIAAAVKRGVWA
jgi:hypothetical protein